MIYLIQKLTIRENFETLYTNFTKISYVAHLKDHFKVLLKIIKWYIMPNSINYGLMNCERCSILYCMDQNIPTNQSAIIFRYMKKNLVYLILFLKRDIFFVWVVFELFEMKCLNDTIIIEKYGVDPSFFHGRFFNIKDLVEMNFWMKWRFHLKRKETWKLEHPLRLKEACLKVLQCWT